MAEVIYSASGVRYNYDVIRHTDTKFTVKKKTKKKGTVVTTKHYGSELSAKRDADRMAQGEGALV